MKFKLLMLLLFVSSSHAWGPMVCKNTDTTVIFEVEKESIEESDYFSYDELVPQAKAFVTVIKNGETYSYKNNLYVFDEGQGNFDMRIYSPVLDQLKLVGSIYFEHEGTYLDGFVQKPILDTRPNYPALLGFEDFADFSELKCDN